MRKYTVQRAENKDFGYVVIRHQHEDYKRGKVKLPSVFVCQCDTIGMANEVILAMEALELEKHNRKRYQDPIDNEERLTLKALTLGESSIMEITCLMAEERLDYLWKMNHKDEPKEVTVFPDEVCYTDAAQEAFNIFYDDAENRIVEAIQNYRFEWIEKADKEKAG